MYVLQNERIVLKTIQYTPGLYKIFDEIVVNAADNKQRNGDMDRLDITIDAASNTISVRNNGKGIPVQMHKEHGVHVPTLIFGHLLTGSNFDDDEKKTTGGRNGYGAKLANVFSTRFVVDCVDAEQGVKFHQVFTDNMSKSHEPTIKKCTAAEIKAGDTVQITFSPDLRRFGMTELDEDTVALLSKRAYDIAGTMASRGGKKLVVSLNGKKLPIKSFKDYLALFDGLESPVAYEKSERWEVGVASSNDASPHHVSFVNAICTTKGGGHVTYIADQVASHLVKFLKKKKKKDVKPAQIKNHLTIYVNCLVENPSFDSQTKDFLTSKPKTFGSKCELPEKFLKAVEKSSIVTTIDSYLSFREREALKRKGGTKKVKLTGISKLDDANYAGTAKSRDCTLIITEGDSAKSLAMAGLSVVGRDFYGVFPLRGKPLNVRDCTMAQAVKNEEIKNLVDILGLKFHHEYDADNIKSLRYGHLMIMADQDTDGSHIKGLVINVFHRTFFSFQLALSYVCVYEDAVLILML
jgi:DNA topoisomerase-2